MHKFNLEYSMNKSSIGALWNMLYLPNGLSEWFAERITVNGDLYTFSWSSHSQQARLLDMEENVYIRFHWLDEDPGTFFEMRIVVTEITGEVTLLITDMADDADEAVLTEMWNRQTGVLRRRLGV